MVIGLSTESVALMSVGTERVFSSLESGVSPGQLGEGLGRPPESFRRPVTGDGEHWRGLLEGWRYLEHLNMEQYFFQGPGFLK